MLKFQVLDVLKKIEIFVNMGPYGSENFLILFQSNLFVNLPCDISYKNCL